MNYGERTSDNMDRSDASRYVKECYIHCDESPSEEKTANLMEYWSKSVSGQALVKYGWCLSGNVCDVGCGMGALSLLALRSFPLIRTIVGVDIFHKAVKLSEVHANHCGLCDRTRFIEANFADSLPENMPVSHFDSVMCFHTLEHIYKSDQTCFVRNLLRISKPGAKLLISLPYDHEYGSNEHVSFFDEKNLRELFESFGCRTILIEHLPAPVNFLTGIFTVPN